MALIIRMLLNSHYLHFFAYDKSNYQVGKNHISLSHSESKIQSQEVCDSDSGWYGPTEDQSPFSTKGKQICPSTDSIF